MATTTLNSFFGVFSDQVYSAKDLNRRCGAVLDRARTSPVTISRNGEQFALFNREQAADLVKAALRFGPTLELLLGALAVVEGKEPAPAQEWLKAFDRDDIRKMIREVMSASIVALRETGDWDAVESIIHEWHESALVSLSGVLDEAIHSPADESLPPLSDPRKLLEPERQKELER
jgi:hypothetical protein